MMNCKDCCQDCQRIGCNIEVNCTGYKAKPKTNADLIRNMIDIELANFLSGLTNGCVNCPMYYPEENDECVKHCNTAWQNWLKQESEGE